MMFTGFPGSYKMYQGSHYKGIHGYTLILHSLSYVSYIGYNGCFSGCVYMDVYMEVSVSGYPVGSSSIWGYPYRYFNKPPYQSSDLLDVCFFLEFTYSWMMMDDVWGKCWWMFPTWSIWDCCNLSMAFKKGPKLKVAPVYIPEIPIDIICFLTRIWCGDEHLALIHTNQ